MTREKKAIKNMLMCHTQHTEAHYYKDIDVTIVMNYDIAGIIIWSAYRGQPGNYSVSIPIAHGDTIKSLIDFVKKCRDGKNSIK